MKEQRVMRRIRDLMLYLICAAGLLLLNAIYQGLQK